MKKIINATIPIKENIEIINDPDMDDTDREASDTEQPFYPLPDQDHNIQNASVKLAGKKLIQIIKIIIVKKRKKKKPQDSVHRDPLLQDKIYLHQI